MRRTQKTLKKFADTVGTEVFIDRFDMRDFSRLEKFPGEVVEKFGRIDYLVNNVGTDVFKTVLDVSFEDWKRSQDIILNAPFLLIKSCLPLMRAEGFGRIVNIGASSKDYMKGAPGLTPFAVHKAALTVLTKSVALEEIRHGITVNMVAPGSTGGAGILPEGARIPVEHIPLGRRVEVDEVVDAVFYFFSDRSGSVTGQCIGVNGGLST